MYVCLCNAVTDTEIQEAIENGHDDAYAIGVKLGAGMCCGSCMYTVQAMIDKHANGEKTQTETVGIYVP